MDRRSFLRMLKQGAISLAALPWFEPRLAFGEAAGSGKSIVLVNLAGGADGLTLFPYVTGALAGQIRTRLRANIGIREDFVLSPLAMTGDPNPIGFHPAWARLVGNSSAQGVTMPGEAGGCLRLVKRVGYTPSDPGRSHDVAQTLYSVGALSVSPQNRRGWLARLMDRSGWDSFQVFGIRSGSKLDFNAERQRPVVVQRVSDFRATVRDFGGGTFARADGTGTVRSIFSQDAVLSQSLIQALGGGSGEGYLDEVYEVSHQLIPSAMDFMASAAGQSLSGLYGSYQGMNWVSLPHQYTGLGLTSPTSFQQACQDCARIVKQSAVSDTLRGRTRVCYLQRGGWDTHSGQRDTIGDLISDVAGGLAGLATDLRQAGLWESTVVLIFTEFGRTNWENSIDLMRAGTDHGYANTHLVLGGKVVPGVSGDDPPVQSLMDKSVNYISPTVDFRSLLWEVLAWAGVESGVLADVFGDGVGGQRVGLFGE